MKEILQILCTRLKRILENTIDGYTDEIRLRSGMPLIITKGCKKYFVLENGSIIEEEKINVSLMENSSDNIKVKGENVVRVTRADIKETMEYVSNHSMYAYEEELRQGYITVQGGHRIGIVGRAVIEDGKIKTIRNIGAVNIRIAKEVKGCADKIIKYLSDGRQVFHTLIVSPPGYGKTTLLRDIIRQFSNGTENLRPKTVAIADERSELAACYQGIAQNDVGIRTDVLDNCPKAEGMILLLRAMSPDIIAVDELGTKRDIEAVEYIMGGGVSVIASVHGVGIEDLEENPKLGRIISSGLFKRIVIIKGAYDKRERFEIYDSKIKKIVSC